MYGGRKVTHSLEYESKEAYEKAIKAVIRDAKYNVLLELKDKENDIYFKERIAELQKKYTGDEE